MCSKSNSIVSKNMDFLKKDLQGDVLVVCEKILDFEESREIKKKEKEDEQVAAFLDYLSKKPYEDISLFIKYLEEWYHWLYVQLMETVNELKKEDPLIKVQTLGGIPNLPPKNVTRTSLLCSVEEGLKRLKKGHYLVLHGMVGSGKTSLAVEALRNYDIVTKSFHEQVYWLTVGHEGAKDPSKLLMELNTRLPQPLSLLSPHPQLASIELAKRFVEQQWTECLIVLDDVTEESVLDIFDIGVKLLITTRDQSIIGPQRKDKSEFIKVTEGFTADETLLLFANALRVPKCSLPHHVSEIHKYSKGHPFTLSLIVSQFTDEFREDLLKNDRRWEYIINTCLAKASRRRSLSNAEIYMKPVELSVNLLSPDEQDCFRKLAVFLEDVNIKPEVLAILWSVDKFRAEDLMVGFVHKSLAVRKWNEPQNSYVYGVHDIIADFLKKDLTAEKEKALHQHLVTEYLKISDGVWSQLPQDDNYIFYYLAHHLMKAGMDEIFQKIYFDLEFLQAKLRTTGPADLLRDMKKYQQLIINGNEDMTQNLLEYTKFIEDFGVWISQKTLGVDIVQAALQTDARSLVHQAGRDLALKNYPGKPYIHCSLPKKKVVPESLALKENSNIVAVCFGRTLNETIIALDNNDIEVFNFKAKHIYRRFSGHKGRINCLNMSPCKTKFLSSSFDNTVRIWTFTQSDNSSGERTPSPRDRQGDYLDLFNVQIHGESSKYLLKHSHPVNFAVFSTSGDMIASLTSNGTVALWKDEEKLWDKKNWNLKSIDFLADDKLVITVSSSQILLLTCDSGTLIKTVDHEFGEEFISLRTLRIADNTESTEGLIMLGRKKMTKMMSVMNEVNSPHDVMDLPFRSQISKFCSTGPFIAVTTDDNSLFVFNPKTGALIAHLQPQKKVVCFCVDESGILAGDQEGKVLLYPLESLSSPFTRVKWASGGEPVLASVNNTRTLINISVGDRTLSKASGEIERMDISVSGEAMVTCSKSGEVTYQTCDGEESLLTVMRPGLVPDSLSLLTTAHGESVVLMSYPGKEALIWRSSTGEVKNLWGVISTIEFAEFTSVASKEVLITAPPFNMWTLDGVNLGKLDLDGPYSISCPGRLVCSFSVSGLSLYEVSAHDGSLTSKGVVDESRHVQLVSFSPSGDKLAFIDTEGFYKVLDCTKLIWEVYASSVELVKKASCLAVSDSGAVCFGGEGLISIVSQSGVRTTAVLDPAYVCADPDGGDTFAVADKTGALFKIYQEDITLSLANLRC